MKNSEEAIEKVLAGLQSSDAPAGMERRILEAVQSRTSTGSRTGWRRMRRIWLEIQTPGVVTRYLTCGVAVAGILAVVLAIPAIHRRGHVPAQSKRNSDTVASLPPRPSEVAAESAQPPAPRSSVRSKEKTKVRRVDLVRASDSVALREMHAPSRPEPPLPLTEQEKLLLRFVHTHSAEELAALDPVKWAARDAEEKAEFEKFFGLSTNGR